MSETTTDPAQAPTKKRSFFKKAAWQTKPKTEEADERDLFNHQKDFSVMMAEETRLKREKRRKEEEERRRKEQEKRRREEDIRRKAEEKHERKRRKLSYELEDEKSISSSSGKTARTSQTMGRSRSPPSPIPVKPERDSLSLRYDIITSSPSLGVSREKSGVIHPGSFYSDSNSADPSYEAPKSVIPVQPEELTRLPAPEPSDDLEEIEDPELAAIAARARARAVAQTEKKDPAVQLFIEDTIPDTKPLLVKVRTSATLEKIRKAWCGMQNFSPEMAKEVFFTWKRNKVFDTTRVIRLGLKIDEHGSVTVENSQEIYDDENLPKVHLEAWTEDLLRQKKKEDAEERGQKRQQADPEPEVRQEEPEPTPAPEKAKIRLVLKAKGKPDFKIAVNPDTSFEHLAAAYKSRNNVPDDQPITLMFDGERLRPMDVIADTEIEDMENLEVYFK